MDEEACSMALVILYIPLNHTFSSYHSGKSIMIWPRFCVLLGLWTSSLFRVTYLRDEICQVEIHKGRTCAFAVCRSGGVSYKSIEGPNFRNELPLRVARKRSLGR
jgi:hypothetical protein